MSRRHGLLDARMCVSVWTCNVVVEREEVGMALFIPPGGGKGGWLLSGGGRGRAASGSAGSGRTPPCNIHTRQTNIYECRHIVFWGRVRSHATVTHPSGCIFFQINARGSTIVRPEGRTESCPELLLIMGDL